MSHRHTRKYHSLQLIPALISHVYIYCYMRQLNTLSCEGQATLAKTEQPFNNTGCNVINKHISDVSWFSWPRWKCWNENGRESGVKEVLMRHFLHAGSLSLHTHATSEQASKPTSSVSSKAVASTFDIKHKLFFTCPFSGHDSQLCAACYLNLNKAMPFSAGPHWWCECTQTPLCLPFTFKKDVTFSKEKHPGPSQPTTAGTERCDAY